PICAPHGFRSGGDRSRRRQGRTRQAARRPSLHRQQGSRSGRGPEGPRWRGTHRQYGVDFQCGCAGRCRIEGRRHAHRLGRRGRQDRGFRDGPDLQERDGKRLTDRTAIDGRRDAEVQRSHARSADDRDHAARTRSGCLSPHDERGRALSHSPHDGRLNMTDSLSSNPYEPIFTAQQALFRTGATRAREWRLDQLARMERMVSENEPELQDAVKSDFKTASQEYVFETQAAIGEVAFQRSQLDDSLSSHAFAALGLEEVAYVKPTAPHDELGYAIYAADGTRLAVVEDRRVALAMIRRHDLEPTSLH